MGKGRVLWKGRTGSPVICTTGQNESQWGSGKELLPWHQCDQWAGMVSECLVTCQVLPYSEQKGGGNDLDSFVF